MVTIINLNLFLLSTNIQYSLFTAKLSFISNNFNIKYCSFINIDASPTNSVLLLSQSGSKYYFESIGFYYCHGNHGSCISCDIVNEFYLNKLCFSNCSSPNAHNCYINAHAYEINIIELNNSVEEYSGKSKYISQYGSHIGGRIKTTIISHNTTDAFSSSSWEAGLVISQASNTIIKFLIHEKIKSFSLMRLYNSVYQHLIINSNFINNSISGTGFFHFWFITGQSALIENSYFIYNTLKPLSYSGGIAIIKNCFFDQNYNSYISSSIGLIYFNNSINNIYQYIYLNTLLCWNFNFIFEKQSCNFYKPFKMNILIFTLNFIF